MILSIGILYHTLLAELISAQIRVKNTEFFLENGL